MSRIGALLIGLGFASVSEGQDWFRLEPPADISTWMEVTITPEFSDDIPMIRFGPGHFVQTDVFWFAYERGGFNMRHLRSGATIASNLSLGQEITAGIHSLTITRLGEVFPPNLNNANQLIRYISPVGIRENIESVAVSVVPEPSALAMIATTAIGLGAIRRRR